MENTFQKEIKFISKTFDGTNHVRSRVSKTATFQELDATVKTQHLLHFKITSLFKPTNEDTSALMNEEEIKKRAVKIDDEVLYEVTVKTINTLLVLDQEFTVSDKNEFLADSGALLAFGNWFLVDKVAPFFQELMPD